MTIPRIKQTSPDFAPVVEHASQPNPLPFQLGDFDFAQAFEVLKNLLLPGSQVKEPTSPTGNSTKPGSATTSDGSSTSTTSANLTLDFSPSLPIPTNPNNVVVQTLPEVYNQISQANIRLITNILTEVRTCQDASGTLPQIDYVLTPEFADDTEAKKAFALFATQDLPLVSVETITLQFQAYYAVQNIQILTITPKTGKPFQIYKYVCRPAGSGDFSFGNYGEASRQPDIMHLFHHDELGLTSISFNYDSQLLAVSLSITPYSTDWNSQEPNRQIVFSATSDAPPFINAADPAVWESQIIEFDKSSGMAPTAADTARAFERPAAKLRYSAKFLYSDLAAKLSQNTDFNLGTTHDVTGIFMAAATSSQYWSEIKMDRFFGNLQPDLQVDSTNPRKFTYKQNKKISGSHYVYTYTQADPDGTAPTFQVIIDIGKNPEELRIIVQTLSHDGKTVLSELGFVSSPQKSPEVSGVIYEIVYPTDSNPAQFYGIIKTGTDDAPNFIHLNGSQSLPATTLAFLDNNDRVITDQFVTKSQIKTAFSLLPKGNSVLRTISVQIPEPPPVPVAEKEPAEEEPTAVSTTDTPRVKKTPEELSTGFEVAIGAGVGIAVGSTSLTDNDLSPLADTATTGAGFHGDVFTRGTYFFTPTVGMSLEGRVGYNGFSTGEGNTTFQSSFLPSSATIYLSGRTPSDFHYGLGAGISLYHVLSTKGEIDVNSDITLSNPDLFAQNLWRPQMAAYLGWWRLSVIGTVGLPFGNAATDVPYITGLQTSVYTFALQCEILKF